MSQEALGYRAGLDRTYISGVERGRRNPTATAMIKLATGLQASVGELVTAADRLAKGG